MNIKNIFLKRKLVKYSVEIITITLLISFMLWAFTKLINKEHVIAVAHITNSKPVGALYLKTVADELLPKSDSACNYIYKVETSASRLQASAIKIECYTKDIKSGINAINNIKDTLSQKYNIKIAWDIAPRTISKSNTIPVLTVLLVSFPIAIILYIGWYIVVIPFFTELHNFLQKKLR